MGTKLKALDNMAKNKKVDSRKYRTERHGLRIVVQKWSRYHSQCGLMARGNQSCLHSYVHGPAVFHSAPGCSENKENDFICINPSLSNVPVSIQIVIYLATCIKFSKFLCQKITTWSPRSRRAHNAAGPAQKNILKKTAKEHLHNFNCYLEAEVYSQTVCGLR